MYRYDHLDILAGAGTIGLEILEVVSDVDAIVIPVGGAGLIAGIACAVKYLRPSVTIIVRHDMFSPAYVIFSAYGL